MGDKITSLYPMVLLLITMSLVIYKSIKNRNQGTLFHPLNFVCVYYAYYVIVPFFFSKENIYKDMGHASGFSYLIWGTLLSFVFIIIGYRWNFRLLDVSKVNNLYSDKNALWLSIGLFVIAFIGYAAFNGFSFNIVRIQEEMVDATANIFNHSDSYVTNLVCLFPVAICLAYYKGKYAFASLIGVIGTLCALMGGARWKFILLILPFVVFYHLYPNVRKINWKIWIPAFLIFYFSMGVIEQTRNYGLGLDIQKMEKLDAEDVTQGASEKEMVYYFSAKVMDVYSHEPPLYFESLYTALTMPIPRAIFPWKPNAQYLRDANMKVFGTVSHGAAYLNVVESYLAFRWIGIIVNGLFLGLLCGAFWRNYQKNSQSIGAIIFLGLFNGVLYVLISRGYLAQELQVFVYYIFIVNWVSLLINKLYKK